MSLKMNETFNERYTRDDAHSSKVLRYIDLQLRYHDFVKSPIFLCTN